MPELDERVAKRVLKGLPAREREAMIRFYLDGHTPAQIEAALGLSEAEFLRIRTRAREQFVHSCQEAAGTRCAQPPAHVERRKVA